MYHVFYNINARIGLQPGMRVRYDCPHTSKHATSDAFFREHRGKTGTIIDFPTEYVGLFDLEGRLPGVYWNMRGINIRFDGEDALHEDINIQHFTLLVDGLLHSSSDNHPQFAKELPEPILYYPEDTVALSGDLLQTKHAVHYAEVDQHGKVLYSLDGTDLVVGAGDIAAIKSRGRYYHLYQDPNSLHFSSSEEELLFWGMDGLSEPRMSKHGMFRRDEWSLKEARAILEQGKGDLILKNPSYGDRIIGRKGQYEVRMLLPCFAQHADHIRNLSLSMEEPPQRLERYIMQSLID